MFALLHPDNISLPDGEAEAPQQRLQEQLLVIKSPVSCQQTACDVFAHNYLSLITRLLSSLHIQLWYCEEEKLVIRHVSLLDILPLDSRQQDALFAH